MTDLRAWAESVRVLARPVVDRAIERFGPIECPDQRAAFVGRFRDGAGSRRAVDGPFLSAWLGVAPDEPSRGACALDVRLWQAAAAGAPDGPRIVTLSIEGPLQAQRSDEALEIWTETELCALHALWRLGARDDTLRHRAGACALWHLANTQPDNATNRPWSAHVFAILGTGADMPEARLYAQTLVHNAMVGTGQLDPLSAIILLDGAETALSHP